MQPFIRYFLPALEAVSILPGVDPDKGRPYPPQLCGGTLVRGPGHGLLLQGVHPRQPAHTCLVQLNGFGRRTVTIPGRRQLVTPAFEQITEKGHVYIGPQ